MDTPKRSLVKAVVGELTGALTLFLVGVCLSGRTAEIGLLTGVFYAIRMGMFVVHEQIWTRIKWGKVRRPRR